MSILINRLILEANTADGIYGLDVTLSKGMFVVRVDNTYGKSTFINSIAYALGMEMALGQATSKPPFPPSLLKKIQDGRGTEHLVISSFVLLEIENEFGEVITLKRNILGADSDSIIRKYDGVADSIKGEGLGLFIHKEGDTTRDLGFYKWLSDFIGWTLPNIPNSYGGQSPLYPALIFPLFFVEQKKGWSSIQSTTPFHFKISQAKKRAFEFLMDMDVNEIVKKKANNKKLLEENSNEWGVSFAHFDSASKRIGGKILGLKDKPVSKLESYKIDVLVDFDGAWCSLFSALELSRTKLMNHTNLKPEVKVGSDYVSQLRELSGEVSNYETKYENVSDEISFIKNQIISTENRIKNLIEDKRKYEDLKKVKYFKVLNALPVLDNVCPTCGKEFSEHGLKYDLECSDNLMTLDESLEFIKSQISTFKGALVSYQTQFDTRSIELKGIQDKVEKYANDIYRLKSDIASDDASPGEEFLRNKIHIENQIKDYETLMVSLGEYRNKFDILHVKYKELNRIRRGFPEYGFSVNDNKKLSALRDSVIRYLSDFGFSSFDSKLVKISQDSYLPTREGFDLGFDTSASDGIRVIWSYLISLFSLREQFSTNHPGLLIFDEPRQQEANKLSFSGLLRGASEVAKSGQVIFATSEEEDVLERFMKGCEYTLLSFSTDEGKILRKKDIQS